MWADKGDVRMQSECQNRNELKKKKKVMKKKSVRTEWDRG